MMRRDVLAGLALTFVGGLVAALWPAIDLAVSGAFTVSGHGFPLASNPALNTLHQLASRGAWVLGIALLAATLVAALRRRSWCHLSARGWLFLLTTLAVGPGLIVNIALKDTWGRARPREVVAFGGTRPFSPALEPQAHATSNGSFVAGDPSVGFWTVGFAFLAVPAWRRRLFWGGIALGGALGLMRLVMGGHFLSDILFAGFIVLLTNAALARLFFPPTQENARA